MDILFIATSTYNDPFAREWTPDLRHTVSFLRKRGVDAGFIYVPVLDEARAIIERFGLPGTVFVDVCEENREQVFGFLSDLRRAAPLARIVLGGILPTLAPEEILGRYSQVDLIVSGEREGPLLECANHWRAGTPVREVAGLVSRDFRRPPAPLLQDLDDLGPMIHDGLGELLGDGNPDDRTGFLVSSRGCYAHCTFCGIPDFYRSSPGRPWRGRSPVAVVDEIQELQETFGIRQFVFQDDNFIGPIREGQERARAIAREILGRGLRIRFFLCCRLNDVQARTLALLKESGLAGIGLSVESTNDESLRLLGKGIRAAAIEPTFGLLEALRIPCEVNMIFFDPYLTLTGVRRNLALIGRLRDSALLSYSDAFPFRELKPFAWSRVARTLRRDGLIDEETARCRFRDPAVARLAAFVGRLEARIPLTFKKCLLFDDVEPGAGPGSHDTMLRFAPALRHWIGLSVVPRYLASACDVVDRSKGDGTAELLALEDAFAGELEWLRHEAVAAGS
jgi:hypothetical protein